MQTETTDWSEFAPIPEDLPGLDAETLAAVRELQGGEVEDSTQHLFATFEPQLAAYFRRNSCQDHEADDLVQTVFIRMLEKIGTLKDATSFHFWLFKIGRHYLINFARDRGRHQEGLEGFTYVARKDSESSTFWARGSFEPSPEARLAVSETVDRRRDVLRRLLKASRLAPRTRESLLLRLRGASYQEIAGELEISPRTARSHVSRASAALLRNLEQIDLDAVALDDEDAALVAALTPELLTFKREAQEADPAYFSAAVLEAGNADFETAEEIEEEALERLAEDLGEKDGKEREEKTDEIERVVDSPADIAAVVRQERRRGRPRRRATRTIPPAGRRDREPALGRLSRDDLSYPLILLAEAAARCGGRGLGADFHADEVLALKAKLTCVGSLLARGRRFAVARRAEEAVRLAILRIGHGRREVRHKVEQGRGLLEAYLGRN